jgi:hypothetical protein
MGACTGSRNEDVMDPMTAFFVGLLTAILEGISRPIEPLLTLARTTPHCS